LSTKTSNGLGTGSFTSSFTGLVPNTTYYVRAYATNSAGTGYGNEVSFTTAGTTGSTGTQGVPCPGASTVKDIDGNTYNTVQIGTQCWTKENLRVTKYNDGTTILLDSTGGTTGNGSGEKWSRLKSGVRTIYAHSQTNLAKYGYLYNGYAAKGIATAGRPANKNLCPTGWHVPTTDEWIKLVLHLGANKVAGGKMKSVTGWNAPNSGATNESGFTGLPGGSRLKDGDFLDLGSRGVWWSSSEADNSGSGMLLNFHLRNDIDFISSNGGYEYSYYMQHGLSVRCLMD
jgi:uncharacterized protein (TIGR02145 family)